MEVVGLLHYKLEELVLEFMQQWPKISKLKQSASTPREPRSWQWRAPKVIKMMEQLKPFQSESKLHSYGPAHGALNKAQDQGRAQGDQSGILSTGRC